MNKTIKKLLAIILVISLCAGPFLSFKLNATATENETLAPDCQVLGASIRKNEGTIDGIRFAVAVREDIWSSEDADNYYLLMLPSRFLTEGADLTKDYTYNGNVKPLDLQVDWTGSTVKTITTDNYTARYKVAHVYVNSIPGGEYDTGLTARMYQNSHGAINYVTEASERSYLYVANAALKDLNTSKTGEYVCKVGSSYSPYSETMRDALIGVKYEKVTDTTWDLVEGNLVTEGTTNENSFILDRENELDLSKQYFMLETSIYVPAACDALKDKVNGLVFGYGLEGYWILDVNYRGNDGSNIWSTGIRAVDDNGETIDGATLETAGLSYEQGWYDYRICVDRSDSTKTSFIVEYKKQDSNHYTTLLDSSVDTSVADITGKQIGYFSTIGENEGTPISIKYNAEVIKTNDALQLRNGNQTLQLEQDLNPDGTGVIRGSMILDYRTTDNNSKKEGIKFSGTDGNGYLFYVSARPQHTTPQLYIGMWKWQGSGWDNTNMKDDAATVPGYAETGMQTHFLENDEYAIHYSIEISYNENGQKQFNIQYTLEAEELDWKLSKEWVVRDEGTPFTGSEVWLYTEDDGNETDVNAGDGKTIYYPTTVQYNTSIEEVDFDNTVENVHVVLEEGERYANPISDADQPHRDDSVEDGGGPEQSMSGDPYFLRYNGKYYLYVSNNSWTCSYRCWESVDLIHYTYLGEYKLLKADGSVPSDDDDKNQEYDMECAYAPEVHFWNGKFYMYTSPGGNGHYVLESTTGLPYGDYKAISNSTFSDKIDGTVFIDDDETKWFLRNNGTGYTALGNNQSWVGAVKMSSMTKLSSSSVTNISKVGITGGQVEGPFLFKRDGIYYLLGTGEYAETPAYRLNYAYNTTGNLLTQADWQMEMEPTLAINTEGKYDSYGHGAVTVGPNLDSYWLAYHMTRSSNDRRIMAINRLDISGTRLSMLGQDAENLVPEEPDFYISYFDALAGDRIGVTERRAGYRSYTDARTNSGEGLHEVNGQLLSGYSKDNLIKTGSRFTAEYSFKNVATDGTFKCLFGGGYVTINGTTVELYKGSTKLASANMLVNGESGWDWSAYHDIIVSYEEGRITVTIDGCTKIDKAVTGLGNGAIGYEGATTAQIGGAVFSNQAFGSSDRECAKSVEGNFYASNYYVAKDGEKASSIANSSVYKVQTSDSTEDVATYTSTYDSVDHTYHIYKDATALKLAQGDRAVYKIDVAKTGWYSLESLFSTDSDGSIIKIQVDDKNPTCYRLRKNYYSSTITDSTYYNELQYQKRAIGNIYLSKGLHTLTVKAVQGDYTAIEYELNYVHNTAINYSKKLNKLYSGNTYFSALLDKHTLPLWTGAIGYISKWSIVTDGGTKVHYTPASEKYEDMKDSLFNSDVTVPYRSLMRVGDGEYTDYSVQVDIKTNAVSGSNNAGIILRLTQPSAHSIQSYGGGKGYYVCLEHGGVSIIRMDYNERKVAHYNVSLDANTYYTLRAKCVDNTIAVYLNDEQIMSYTDPYVFACGAPALYSNESQTYYKNLVVTGE